MIARPSSPELAIAADAVCFGRAGGSRIVLGVAGDSVHWRPGDALGEVRESGKPRRTPLAEFNAWCRQAMDAEQWLRWVGEQHELAEAHELEMASAPAGELP